MVEPKRVLKIKEEAPTGAPQPGKKTPRSRQLELLVCELFCFIADSLTMEELEGDSFGKLKSLYKLVAHERDEDGEKWRDS